MDSATSPPRSAGNPSSNRASNGGGSDVSNPFAKRHSLEDFNDTSSVTTASSSSRNKSRPCHVCKEWGSKSKPLIQCSRCGGRWHPCCHKPEILDTKAADFMCQRCQKKEMNLAPDSSSASAPMRPPAVSSPASSQEPLRRCEVPKCKNLPLTDPVGGKVLCKLHFLEQRHNKQKQPPAAMMTASAKKPIQKDKLYNIKPEDRHLLKRKRTSSTKTASSSSLEVFSKESDVPRVARKEGGRTSMRSMVSSKSPPVIDRPQSIGEVYAAGQASGTLRKNTADTSLNSLLDIFAIMEENRKIVESPDYEPPSPKEPDDNTSTNKNAQISSHNKTVDELPSTKPRSSANGASYKSPYSTNGPEIGTESSRTSMSGLATRTATLSDDEMPDLEPLDDDAGVANQELPTTAAEYLPAAAPALNAKEPETDTVAEVFEEDLSTPAPHPKSIAARKRAENFDSTELDFWIKKQSEPKPEPTEKELLEDQLWGHIDPRVVWPKEYSEEWYAAKRAEIDARPSRKQRFGKVRPQLEERQLSDHELREHQRFAEEFGGIKYSEDFKPAVIEGVLCMVEQNDTVDRATGEIRHKKKKDLKIYRVG